MITSRSISRRIVGNGLWSLVLMTAMARADTTAIGLLTPVVDNMYRQNWSVSGAWDVRPQARHSDTSLQFLTNTMAGYPDDARLIFLRHLHVQIEEGYALDVWLKVNNVWAPHDATGAPIALHLSLHYPELADAPGTLPLSQGLYFDEDSIGWLDDSGSFAMDTTDDFHHYRVEVARDGAVRVLVDDQQVLQRTGFKLGPYIAFGDTSASPGLASDYAISRITVTGETTTPVGVDVMPSICPNAFIDYRSTRKVVVAIPGNRTFDVTRLDPGTVRVNGVAPVAWNVRDAARWFVQPRGFRNNLNFECTTDSTDGWKDLVMAFEPRALGDAIDDPARPFGHLMRVTGRFKPEFGGQHFAGEDVAVFTNIPAP